MRLMLGLGVTVFMYVLAYLSIPTFVDKPSTLKESWKTTIIEEDLPAFDQKRLDKMILDILSKDLVARDNALSMKGVPPIVRRALLDNSIKRKDI